MFSAGLVAYSNWLILSAMVVPRFLEPKESLPVSHIMKLIDICKDDSVDIFFGVEAVRSLLLFVLGGETFSFAKCSSERLLSEEDSPFFTLGGEQTFTGFERRDDIWILLFLTESVIS